jgi:ABC-type lipoprotein export system ATPase subunit
VATADLVAVSCRAVVRVYGSATEETQALRGIDLALHRHELTVVTGPSGSGKSSLLGLVAARDEPSAGWVEVLGHDLGTTPRRVLRDLRRREVALVPQRTSAGLFPGLDVLAHLSQVARWRGARVDGHELDGLVERLGLGDCARRTPETLSGGEQQRVTVAMAAVGAPPVVVADEPTAELDSDHAQGVLDLLADLAARGSAVVVSSHDERVVRRAGRVVHLRHGVLAEEHRAGGAVAMIDSSGRVQLPPEALAAFPDQRAVVRVDDDGVHLSRPGEEAP